MTYDPFVSSLIAIAAQAASNTQKLLSDIQIVSSEIDTVIGQVEEEIDQNERARFQRQAVIEETSFGGGDYASALGNHHTRAYHVVDETLGGVQTDLQDFAAACREARQVLMDSDAQAAEDFTLVTEFVAAIDGGTTADGTQGANHNAQQNPGEDV